MSLSMQISSPYPNCGTAFTSTIFLTINFWTPETWTVRSYCVTTGMGAARGRGVGETGTAEGEDFGVVTGAAEISGREPPFKNRRTSSFKIRPSHDNIWGIHTKWRNFHMHDIQIVVNLGQFFQKPEINTSKFHMTFSIFQSRRFAPQNFLRQSQFFQSKCFAPQIRL